VLNLDLTGEWYLPNSGVVSVSVFQKNVDGFITRGAVGLLSTLATGPELAAEYGINPADASRYNVTLASNGLGSTVKGFEFSYAQGLAFLPRPFNTMNAQFNFTHVSVGGDNFTTKLAQLQAATTRSVNLVLGWRLGRFNLLGTVSHTGDVETGFGATATAPSTFTEAITKADFTVNYTLNSKATLYVQVRNLTGEGRREFQTPSDPTLFKALRVPSRVSEFGDPIFYFGVRGRF
jgi:hypothetical protein